MPRLRLRDGTFVPARDVLCHVYSCNLLVWVPEFVFWALRWEMQNLTKIFRYPRFY